MSWVDLGSIFSIWSRNRIACYCRMSLNQIHRRIVIFHHLQFLGFTMVSFTNALGRHAVWKTANIHSWNLEWIWTKEKGRVPQGTATINLTWKCRIHLLNTAKIFRLKWYSMKYFRINAVKNITELEKKAMHQHLQHPETIRIYRFTMRMKFKISNLVKWKTIKTSLIQHSGQL